jgi:ATP phosphoribosyltransferase regulatory subunit HisZ
VISACTPNILPLLGSRNLKVFLLTDSLVGSNSIDADIEVIVLMLESLKLLAIEPIVLSLGNVAVFDALIAQMFSKSWMAAFALGISLNILKASSSTLASPSSFINALNLFAFLSVLLLKKYHTGVVFCAYNEDYSKALAQGGRYNGLSASFGRPRAATGFSFDLKGDKITHRWSYKGKVKAEIDFDIKGNRWWPRSKYRTCQK